MDTCSDVKRYSGQCRVAVYCWTDSSMFHSTCRGSVLESLGNRQARPDAGAAAQSSMQYLPILRTKAISDSHHNCLVKLHEPAPLALESPLHGIPRHH